jgi:uridine phosphorylase
LSPVQPIHLHPTAPLGERVLLPGDPGRALMLAQTLLDEPRMFNHNRGLWGYSGLAADGEAVTIQATGMGGPSAAIVLSELVALGARRAIRVGTCAALVPELGLGDLVIAGEALCGDGTSRALDAGARVAADPLLLAALARQAPGARRGPVDSVDLFYDEREREHGDAVAVEMEAATLFALGATLQVPVACVLTVSDVFDASGARTRIAAAALHEAAETMGRVALAALCE